MGSAMASQAFDNSAHVIDVAIKEVHLDFTNSRRKISNEAIDTLAASISKLGLLQPVNVTPRAEGGYTLIAGFTRFLAVKKLGRSTITASVFVGDDAALMEANMAENLARTELSLVSSVEAVKRLSTQLSGDYDEVARRLGYTPKQMADRIALAACSSSVLNALEDGKIKLGHAVQLAAFTEAVQEKTLPKILDKGWTVETLKERAGKKKIKLALAKFDADTACSGCPHNSSAVNQGTLFGEELEPGICSNAPCFQTKQLEVLEHLKVIETERLGDLIELTTVDTNAIRPIKAESLGESQVSEGCSSCPNNISIIDNRVTASTFTKISSGICNNLKCFSKKASAYAETISNASCRDREQEATARPSQSSKPKAESKPSTSPVSNAGLTSKQGEVADRLLYQHALNTLSDDPLLMWRLIYISVDAYTNASHQPTTATRGMNGDALKAGVKQTLTDWLVKGYHDDKPVSEKQMKVMQELIANREHPAVEVRKAWQPDALASYPIAHIVELCRAAGLEQHVNADSEGRFSKLMNQTKKNILTSIKDVTNFDWTQYAPEAFAERYKRFTQKETEK